MSVWERDLKIIRMSQNFDYRPSRAVTIAYEAGHVYRRVTEAAARAILKAGAGEVVDDNKPNS